MSKRTPATDPLLAVAYLRVSTDHQQLGPEAQRAAIEAWAAREGVQVVKWCQDLDVSGGSDLEAREGLTEAIAELRVNRAGLLVVAKRDRLARDVYIAATLERAIARCGARVACADGVANGDTPADAFLRTILDGAAQYERELIRARVKSALAVKIQRGERCGSVRYGYRLAADGVHLEPFRPEQDVITAAKALRASGLSLRAVTAKLEADGVRGRKGVALRLTQVARLLA